MMKLEQSLELFADQQSIQAMFMNSRDGFAGGFAIGAVVGGVVGGIVGVVLASRLAEGNTDQNLVADGKGKSQRLTTNSMETDPLSLEEKIAQLNQAIDDVRHQLQNTNGTVALENYAEPSLED
ncbi:MAG: hypothetical protein ACFBSC_04730 [Microcoleaceae cyanobacterium]